MVQAHNMEKKSLMGSYIEGIKDTKNGASFTTIMRYFFPEFITALVLYSLPVLIDAWFISGLKSTAAYAAQGVATTWLHLITKMAEGLSVGVIIMGGQFNGAGDFKKVGRTFTDAFWITVIIGFLTFLILFFGAQWIYFLYGVTSQKMMRLGVPYFQLRAVGIFLSFIFFALVGFLRSIKNTRVPMLIYALGAVIFVISDWLLIYGKCGFKEFGMQGSAYAAIIQISTMLLMALGYILFNPEYRKYQISLLRPFSDLGAIRHFFALSWRVVIDKGTMAAAYVWLGSMLTLDGKYGLASFTVIRQMEQFAILPAVAFAQIITFMVSNDVGAGNWSGVKSNIKKILFLSTFMVFAILIVLSLKPVFFIRLFDVKGKFTGLSAAAFPVLSIFVFFDLLQLIFSGALRGAANVSLVMWVRIFVFVGFFVPISFLLKTFFISSDVVKFILIYATFYIATGIMNIIYVNRFRRDAWKEHIL